MNTTTFGPLIIKGRSREPTLEDEYGAYFALAPNSLVRRFLANINRDKSFLDCLIVLERSENELGRIEWIETNRLLMESLATRLVGRFYKREADFPTYYSDISGKDPYLTKGIVELLHGKTIGVALTELANFIHIMNWLGINIQNFTIQPGCLMQKSSRLCPGNVMKIYRDVLETCEFLANPVLWKFNWINNHAANASYNHHNEIRTSQLYRYVRQFQ